ncbi:hypothetical protein [Lysinibacillus sphaericus]|uniref:Uncharacterized protein n=1 Tax=Lysinibacillus sphaericus OT4b.31 TaxID=1285586 RepID=R7ZFL7_LYSSH|nr:hypothetical protein [Lysinibacillus sphaericus]EON72831.1 hypothetical protein H131_08988 [Lysinibacillus sphaericus OT4b.31]
MKRFWLQTPDKNEFEINTSNNKLSLYESSTETSYTLAPGKYTLEKLVSILISEGITARIGELKADKKATFIVLFLKDSFTNANGNLITFLGGIESIDTGDRKDSSVIYI